jgi:hypothetical protein
MRKAHLFIKHRSYRLQVIKHSFFNFSTPLPFSLFLAYTKHVYMSTRLLLISCPTVDLGCYRDNDTFEVAYVQKQTNDVLESSFMH